MRVPVRHLTTIEHQAIDITPAGSEQSLSEAEAEVLLAVGMDRRGFCDRGYRSIRLAQYCGVVNLGHRVLEVLPKVGIERAAESSRSVLLRLLRVSGGLDGFRIPAASQALDRSPLLDIFVAAFLDSVTALVRGGLLRQYHERDDDLRVVRGRIAFGRQVGTHFNRPDVIASRYDELTVDQVWNRSIKAGLRICRNWIVSDELRRRWIELYAAFEDVADVTPDIGALDRLVYDRHATRYRDAMKWVRWIIALLSPAMMAGNRLAPAFLFDMNAVFERVAYGVVRQHAGARSWSVHRGRGRDYLARIRSSSTRRAFHLRPDIIVSSESSVELVADAKWKQIAVTSSGFLKPSSADMYQMTAYASAFGVKRLALIYPATDDTRAAKQTVYEIRTTGPGVARVAVLCIDVERDDLPLAGSTMLSEAHEHAPA